MPVKNLIKRHAYFIHFQIIKPGIKVKKIPPIFASTEALDDTKNPSSSLEHHTQIKNSVWFLISDGRIIYTLWIQPAIYLTAQYHPQTIFEANKKLRLQHSYYIHCAAMRCLVGLIKRHSWRTQCQQLMHVVYADESRERGHKKVASTECGKLHRIHTWFFY